VKELKQSGYQVSFSVVNCAVYGVPQHRNRLVLLASKFGEVKLLTQEEFGSRPVTVKEAIGTMPRIQAGACHPRDPLHQSAALSETNMQRMESSKPGGTWRDWSNSLVADCHKKETGKSYPSVYGRMTWDAPAPTMTTQFFGFGNGRFGHPEQNRAISLREGAILQGFPKTYKFAPPGEPLHKRHIGKLIGNAVPVAMGEVIGETLFRHIETAIKNRVGTA
jgi:DNA (cytosine-5)-methyltransferase 1